MCVLECANHCRFFSIANPLRNITFSCALEYRCKLKKTTMFWMFPKKHFPNKKANIWDTSVVHLYINMHLVLVQFRHKSLIVWLVWLDVGKLSSICSLSGFFQPTPLIINIEKVEFKVYFFRYSSKTFEFG